MEPLPASYYGKLDKNNPVISSLEKDLKEFRLQIKKVREAPNFNHSSYSRGSIKLFNIWKKYQPRLPAPYFEECLLQTADFLYECKFYKLAQWQGYSRYLHRFCAAGLESIKDVEQFKQTFFPEGFDTEGAKLTFRALQGECLCEFYLEREQYSVPHQSGVQKLLDILVFLRLMMQAIMPHKSLCWILYNGSIHIYNICRFLMSMSHSAQVLEYLLWACVSLELSIPLLIPRFLPWRATLYCAVCECYYDSQAGVQAEVFSRRALCKISELAKLEDMSGSLSSAETQQAFKEATIKLAVMVFKQSVYESWRKNRGYFRAKRRRSFKESHNISWPRTLTERMLTELFEGNAAQFLAVLEALRVSSRRLLHTGFSDKPEVQKVVVELMSAGISILSGNGGSSDTVRNDNLPPSLSAITPTFTIMEMARAGENLISVDAAVKFVKLLFTYEQWDTFCSLSKSLVTVLSNLEVRCFQKAELELTLLEALVHLVSTHKIKLCTKDVMTETLPGEDKSVDQIAMTDELLNLVETLHVCVCEAAQGIQLDGDMVVDIVLFLWAKCKVVFQKAQGLHSDSVCYLGRSENQDKWAQTLFLLCEVAHECQLAETDPVMVAEMTIRLAMVLECSADSPPQTGTKTASTEVNSSQSTPTGKHSSTATPLMGSQAELLEITFSVLERGLECLSKGKAALLHCDASAIADTVLLQKFGGVHMRSSDNGQPESTRTSSVSSLCMDLHVELLAFYHRVFIKLLDTFPDDEIAGSTIRSVAQTDQGRRSREHSMNARAECVLLEKIKKNKISKALFLMQKSLLFHKKDFSTKKGSKKLIEEAAALLEKAELEEKRLASASVPVEMSFETEDGCTPPPPPVLLSCSNWCMTFTPAPYALEEKVSWYRIYGKEEEGHNLKVRIGDSHLPGTGDIIPSRGERLFCVSGLEPNQKYIFAVAAYDAQGNLVGKTIGEATRPLLASLPLPLLTTWAHLAQVAYQTGQYAVAKKACSELWSHFTVSLTSDSEGFPVPKNESGLEGLAQMRLRTEILRVSSPLLQQLCLSTMFIQTDIHIQERALYCDSHYERIMLIWEQEDRLAECERMLVAIDMALHLKDSSGALQAIVNCYGLLAPLIYYQIPSDAVIQVLLKCLTVLQEIPALLKQKRPAATAESLQHMVACIAQYLAKALQTFKKYPLASSVIEQGKKLLQEITQSPQQTPSSHALIEQNRREKLQKKVQMEELREQLKALEGIVTKSEEAVGEAATDSQCPELTGNEDPAVLQMVIGQSSLQNAFKDVMKFKQRSFFMKFAGLLLQRALQENQLELVLQWGQEIFSRLSRQDERLTVSKKPQEQKRRELKKYTSSVIEYSNKKQKVISVLKDKKKKEQKLSSQGTPTPEIMWSRKQAKAMETLLKHLAPLSRMKLKRMRQKGTKECLWRCHINLVLAQAHLGLLRKNLETQSRMTLQKCYNKMPPLLFSLAHTGTLVKWKNVPQHIRPPELSVFTPKGMPQPKPIHKTKHKIQAPHITEDESAEGEADSELDTPRTQLTDDSDISEPDAAVTLTQHMDFQPLDILCKASVHLRRAMVLAHREGAWISLQWVCGIMWDQMSTTAFLIECGKTSDSPSKLTLDQFYKVFTPLLVLASDLLMDMMERLQKWKVYDEEDEDLEARSLGGGMLRDLLWLRNVVLHTLELLYYQGKWETLSYLAFRYNTYTREHYTHIITPLLVHAQRRLLERINYFEGPPAPQPHFIHTETATGEKITCRNYAGKQLLLHWPSSAQNHHKGTAGNAGPELLQLAEVNRAMCVVCVPLDTEDTLRCFRETMTKRRHTLRAFQHSRTLLLLLLADTQHSMEVPFWKEFHSELQGKVEFNLAATNPPSISPPDLTNEDYSSVGSVYSSPLPPSHIQTVLSSYSSAIKYLQANKYNALLVQALHDVGNLHFYNGNQKAAHLHWNKALDCALQCTGVLELWDGDSWPSSSTQEPLREAGIWGCLQGALLCAKIAQYILTSDISQRTKCCLLSAKLFKCLLKASLPHPDNDLEYSSYSLKTELIPGLDVFSEPEWGTAAATVACLDFLGHWLYTSGHHLTALPLLALYQYIASKVCQDPHHTVSCRILKVKVLTELCLFAEAVREIHILTLGEEVPVPYISYSGGGETEAEKNFRNSRPLLNPSNLQVLEEVVNKRPSEDVMALYGPKLTHRLFLARIQLITALCGTVHDLPDPVSPEIMLESQVENSVTSDPGTPNHNSEEFPCNTSPTTKNSAPEGLQLETQKDKLTLGQVKAWLLREASIQLRSQLFALQNIHTDPEELELAVETRLLLSGLSLQQGKTAYSADLAVSALRLLQDSPLFQSKNLPQLPPSAPLSAFRQPNAKAKLQQKGLQGSDPAPDPELRDVQVGVEAIEYMGRSFWLRCRLSVVQSFTAHLPGTAVCPGVDSSVEAARLLKEGLAEAEAWGDPDTQALLLLQEATLNTHCGKSPVESASILQEAVSLLSGRNALSLRSGLALAKATLLLSELRRTGSQSRYLLTQKLLQQQLCTLGESIVLKAGGGLELPSTQRLRNIYHPQLPLLARATMHLGNSLALQAMNTSLEDGEDPSKPWTTAQEVLQSAFIISQTSACRDQQLEAEILYCRGMVERILMSMNAFQHQAAVETFLESITLTNSHSHNLQLIHRCYMEMALIYLQQCQNNTSAFLKPASSPAQADSHTEPQASEIENITVDQSQILLFWVCLRAAIMTMEAITSSSQLCSFSNLMSGQLPLTSFKALPDFAANDLLHPCGGMEDPVQFCRSPTPDEDNDQSSRYHDQLTWVHLFRYHTHLLNLRHIATRPVVEQCVDGLMAAAGGSHLFLKLAQLHTFFSGHLEAYKEQCVVPDPPAALIRMPQTTQLADADELSECRPKQLASDLYPWATVDTQQLCIQWYRPALELNGMTPNTIKLIFGLNKAPLSAVQSNSVAVAELKAGQRLISEQRLKTLHDQLISVCMEVKEDSALSASPASSTSSSFSSQKKIRSSSKSLDKFETFSPQRQMLLEKTKHICTEIRNLLKPELKSHPFTEVPFEPSVQTLCDLERCFNPTTGAILKDKVLTDWLFSLLL